MAHRSLTIDEHMVEQASDIVNLALANRDLIIEIFRYERALGVDKSWATSAYREEITVRQPTPDERRNGVRYVTRIDSDL